MLSICPSGRTSREVHHPMERKKNTLICQKSGRRPNTKRRHAELLEVFFPHMQIARNYLHSPRKLLSAPFLIHATKWQKNLYKKVKKAQS